MMQAEETTEDLLLGGRVRLLQPRRGYRVAIDPVLLAAATPAGDADEILDVGAGTGAVALCLAARLPEVRVTGLEREAELCEFARRSVAMNGLAHRVTMIAGELDAPPAELRARSFDHVVTNPPFLAAGTTRAPAGGRALAHVESLALEDWLAGCLRRLRPGGHLTLIHRADRLDGILASLSGKAGEIAILPLLPQADAPVASRAIVRARKGAGGPLRLCRPLILHAPEGHFTSAAEAVLRHGAALSF
jgi:tRNA1(Val) A37 N6-methylase TrmN6